MTFHRPGNPHRLREMARDPSPSGTAGDAAGDRRARLAATGKAPALPRAAAPVAPAQILHGPVLPAGMNIGCPGVSLVTCCKDRNANLLRALRSWLDLPEISEIVVVDWSSETPIARDLARAGLDDPRCRIIRVEGEGRWILSQAFNLGFRHARFDRILKVDADIVLDPMFFVENPLGPGQFIAGNWRKASKTQFFVNGFFYLHACDLARVNGFNEYITTYGHDDDDLYDRLAEAGVTRCDVAPLCLHHLDHDDADRLRGDQTIEADFLAHLHNSTMFKIRANRLLATIMPRWNRSCRMTPFSPSEGAAALRRAGPVPHAVPPHIAQVVRTLTTYEVLSWRLGPQVFDLPPDALLDRLRHFPPTQTDEARLRAHVLAPAGRGQPGPASGALFAPPGYRRRDLLYIDAQHGLGNRLRALGSASAIARATDRRLVVIWQPDHHCQARVADLFTLPDPVLEHGFAATAPQMGLSLTNYMEIEPGATKDAALDLTPGQDAYIRSAYVLNHPAAGWDATNAALARLRPTAPVLELMHGLPERFDIGLHIRMEGAPGTDRNSYDSALNWTAEGHRRIHEWREKSHFTRFLARLDALLEERPGASIFLAADRPETYAAFAARHGERILRLERGLFDRSARQAQFALADMLCLSRCTRLLGSNWSSFTEGAQRLARQPQIRELAGVDF